MKLNGLMWWVNRWRASSAFTSMNLSAQGAYRNLLDEAWLRGGKLPQDEHLLARACGDARRWKKLRPIVMRWFYLEPDGCWHNATLDEVLRETHVRLTKERTRREHAAQHMREQRANKRANTAGDLGIRKDLAN